MFLYDGSHAAADQRRAIEHFYDSLDEWAVVVIDDWNWPGVRDGTREGMKALDIPVVFEKEIILPAADVVDMPHHRGRDSWWNGIFVMVVDKRAVPLSKSQRSRTIAISTEEAEVETPPLEVIVFSKDRACQLEALLRSMGLFFEYPHRLTVLCTSSQSTP